MRVEGGRVETSEDERREAHYSVTSSRTMSKGGVEAARGARGRQRLRRPTVSARSADLGSA